MLGRLCLARLTGLRKLTTQSWTQPTGLDTGISVYNCVVRKKVPLILRDENVATWYTCGPTVYDQSHIGHASCYVKLDIIQRLLRDYFNVNLISAMNITDIDDKIIAKGKSGSKQWHEIAKFYENEFWSDMKKLNVKEPDIKIRVTENIPLIIEFIECILQKGLAYVGNDKSVYFRTEAYPNYGKLQRLNLESTSHEIKKSHIDFVLWKAKKDNEPSWLSPWGEGRPGWHIECSALASKIFGEVIDFHAGGLDLKFPHHENEEAQSCAYHNNSQWVNYWLHTGHLSLKGQADKMSKSLKNTVSIQEMLANYSSDDFRMACLLSNYKNSMEFSDDMMKTARNTKHTFITLISDCQAYLQGIKSPQNVDFVEILQTLRKVEDLVCNSLKDDFDTAQCVQHLSILSGVISKEINKPEDTIEYSARLIDTIAAANNFLKKIFRTFGFKFVHENLQVNDNFLNPKELVDDILAIRFDIRKHGLLTKSNELLKISDDIRNNLKNKGIEIKDHKNGTSWSYAVK